MSILQQTRSYDGFFTDILSANSEGTKNQYRSALLDFEKFCKKEHNMNLEQILGELKAVKIQDQILFLQRWVNDSTSHPRTKRQRAGFLNKYFYYRNIDIDNRDFKQLKFGKMGKSFKKPLTKEILLQIFNRSSKKRQALYLFLISTGCRISEAVKLRKKDFDLTPKRIKVQIYQAKNDETRIGYLTLEAGRMIKPILDKLGPNDLVFGINENPDSATVTEQQCFRRVTDLLGLGTERRRSNLRHWTIHTLRSYTFTQFTKTHNADIGHMYLGREQYLDTYLQIPEDEQLDQFIQVEPLLLLNEAQPETDTILSMRKELDETKAEMKKYKKSYDEFERLSTDKEFRNKELMPFIESLKKRVKDELRSELLEEIKKEEIKKKK